MPGLNAASYNGNWTRVSSHSGGVLQKVAVQSEAQPRRSTVLYFDTYDVVLRLRGNRDLYQNLRIEQFMCCGNWCARKKSKVHDLWTCCAELAAELARAGVLALQVMLLELDYV